MSQTPLFIGASGAWGREPGLIKKLITDVVILYSPCYTEDVKYCHKQRPCLPPVFISTKQKNWHNPTLLRDGRLQHSVLQSKGMCAAALASSVTFYMHSKQRFLSSGVTRLHLSWLLGGESRSLLGGLVISELGIVSPFHLFCRCYQLLVAFKCNCDVALYMYCM